MKKMFLALVALVSFTFIAAAADVNGKYTADVPGRNGNTQQTTFTLKTSGDKVEGTVSGRQGDTAISDGKVAGDTITFKVVREFNGNSFTQSYTGKVKADSIDFTVDNGRGNPVNYTAKKQ